MHKGQLVSGFVGGVNYSKKYPDLMEFNEFEFVDKNLDWSNYNCRSRRLELGRCSDAFMAFMDLGKDERDEHIDELKRLIWYSKVVLGEEKHQLNRKKAFDELRIGELFAKYGVK